MSVVLTEKNHRIFATHRTVEFVGGARTIEVKEIEVFTIPSNIYFEFRQPIELQIQASIDARATLYAGLLEDVAASPEVIALAYVQDVSVTNQLEDLVNIYVESSTGRSSDFFTQPLGLLEASIVAPKIVALQRQLDAEEAA